ncbi:uncharacterized protein N7459_000671, partial [Penicillium hispanicum]|uniref:uncharacterized protein n=1 Tax=Penicillium hispanicum TaxID=1080232 RepID=UPI002541D07D
HPFQAEGPLNGGLLRYTTPEVNVTATLYLKPDHFEEVEFLLSFGLIDSRLISRMTGRHFDHRSHQKGAGRMNPTRCSTSHFACRKSTRLSSSRGKCQGERRIKKRRMAPPSHITEERVLIGSRYKSQAAAQAHLQASYFRAFSAKLPGLMAKPSELRAGGFLGGSRGVSRL